MSVKLLLRCQEYTSSIEQFLPRTLEYPFHTQSCRNAGLDPNGVPCKALHALAASPNIATIAVSQLALCFMKRPLLLVPGPQRAAIGWPALHPCSQSKGSQFLAAGCSSCEYRGSWLGFSRGRRSSSVWRRPITSVVFKEAGILQ